MPYWLTVEYRGGDISEEECATLEEAFQYIADGLQTTKDHWNTFKVAIEWEPPAHYCHDGAGHVYEHYSRDDGNLYCECGAKHRG